MSALGLECAAVQVCACRNSERAESEGDDRERGECAAVQAHALFVGPTTTPFTHRECRASMQCED